MSAAPIETHDSNRVAAAPEAIAQKKSDAQGTKIPVARRQKQLKPFPLAIAGLFGALAIYFIFAPLGPAANSATSLAEQTPAHGMGRAQERLRDNIATIPEKVASFLPDRMRPASEHQPLVCPAPCVVKGSEAHLSALREAQAQAGQDGSLGERLAKLPEDAAAAIADKIPGLPDAVKPASLAVCPPGCVNPAHPAGDEAEQGGEADQQQAQQQGQQQGEQRGVLARMADKAKSAMHGMGCPYLEATGQDAGDVELPHSHPPALRH